jgi:hypothetical protein
MLEAFACMAGSICESAISATDMWKQQFSKPDDGEDAAERAVGAAGAAATVVWRTKMGIGPLECESECGYRCGEGS